MTHREARFGGLSCVLTPGLHLRGQLRHHPGPGRRGRVLIYDGTGYGADGTSWGGELLVGDLRGYARAGHLLAVPQPGGDRAAREPWRMACAWLVATLGPEPELRAALRGQVDPARWSAVAEMGRTGFSAPPTSSMGRLFDAVAALCGVYRYEGQAAIELEGAVAAGDHGAYGFGAGPELVLDPRPALGELLADLAAGTPAGIVSSRFHAGVARATAGACERAASGAGVASVALSGGVFQNRRLLGESAAAVSG